jgi:hypothetical protein
MFPFALAMAPAGSLHVRVITELEKRPDRGIRLQDDASAVTSVASVRTAARLVGLTMESNRAGTARAGLNLNGDFVDERHG